MELIRGAHNLRPRHRGCVLTIGNFDGVHLGHRSLLAQLNVRARSLAVPSVVMCFEPHPQEFFAGDAKPARLARLREKLLALAEAGVDRVLVLRFDARLAHLEAESFVRDLLIDRLGVRYLVIGDDFRFGRGRRGDFEMLGRFGAEAGFELARTSTVTVEGDRVSSTRIRDVLARGDLALAERLLGRRYAVCGRVAHGDERGRTIGFPTANVHLHRIATPLSGVYAVSVHGVAGGIRTGVANLGRRPTVGGTREQLEVHLFDFSGDLYGRALRVEFHARLRAERRFDSFADLAAQIHRDAGQARAWFAAHPANRGAGR